MYKHTIFMMLSIFSTKYILVSDLIEQRDLRQQRLPSGVSFGKDGLLIVSESLMKELESNLKTCLELLNLDDRPEPRTTRGRNRS